MFRVLTTNHGPHPADKWALFAAQDVFDISKMAPDGEREAAARRVQLAIADALEAHFRRVQEDEKKNLAEYEDHCSTPHDATGYLDGAVQAVLDAVQGTPWEHQYDDPEQRDLLRRAFEGNFVEAQSIERKYHADRTGNPAAVAYRNLFLAGSR